MSRRLSCLLVAAVIAIHIPLRAPAADSQPTTQAAAAAPEMVAYENAEHGFKLMRPKAWESMGSIGSSIVAMFLQLGDEHAKAANTLMISVTHSASPPRLDDVVDQAVAGLRVQFDGMKIIDNKPSTLGGKTSRRIVFTGNGTGADVKIRLDVCVVDTDAFCLMLQTVPDRYAALEPTFDAITGSFQFVNKGK